MGTKSPCGPDVLAETMDKDIQLPVAAAGKVAGRSFSLQAFRGSQDRSESTAFSPRIHYDRSTGLYRRAYGVPDVHEGHREARRTLGAEVARNDDVVDGGRIHNMALPVPAAN